MRERKEGRKVRSDGKQISIRAKTQIIKIIPLSKRNSAYNCFPPKLSKLKEAHKTHSKITQKKLIRNHKTLPHNSAYKKLQ